MKIPLNKLIFEDTPSRIHEGHKLQLHKSKRDGTELRFSPLLATNLLQEVPDSGGVIDFEKQLPTAENQGDRGSCFSFAGCAMKTYQEKTAGTYPLGGLSEAYLYSKCKQIDGYPNEDGSTNKVLFKVLQNSGVCLENTLPYSTLSSLPSPKFPSTTSAMDTEALKYRIKNYAEILSPEDTTRTNATKLIRQALLQQGPFVMGLYVFSSFVPDENGIIPIPGTGSGADTYRGGHDVLVIGADPNKGIKIYNSWSKDWGIRGCAYLKNGWESAYWSPTGIGKAWFLMEAFTSVDLEGLIIPKPDVQSRIVQFTIGSKDIYVNGVKTLTMDTAPYIENNRMMVPVGFAGLALGASVSWDADTQTATFKI